MKEGIKLTNCNLERLMTWGVIISASKDWTKADSKLMFKLSILLKENNHQVYLDKKYGNGNAKQKTRRDKEKNQSVVGEWKDY